MDQPEKIGLLGRLIAQPVMGDRGELAIIICIRRDRSAGNHISAVRPTMRCSIELTVNCACTTNVSPLGAISISDSPARMTCPTVKTFDPCTVPERAP